MGLYKLRLLLEFIELAAKQYEETLGSTSVALTDTKFNREVAYIIANTGKFFEAIQFCAAIIKML